MSRRATRFKYRRRGVLIIGQARSIRSSRASPVPPLIFEGTSVSGSCCVGRALRYRMETRDWLRDKRTSDLSLSCLFYAREPCNR